MSQLLPLLAPTGRLLPSPRGRPHRRSAGAEVYPRFGGDRSGSLLRGPPFGGLTIPDIADKMERMRVRIALLIVLCAAVVPVAAYGGQSATKKVSALLTPGAVAPKTKATASGSVVVTLDAKAGKACWTISVKGTTTPFSAHVHRGKPGKNGPVVIPLGDTWSKKGCVFAPSKAIAAVAASPKSYYVDVHTRAFVNGIVRGQLHVSS